MVISRASTILYESIAAGRKVVYYNPGIEALPIIDDFPKSTLIKIINSEYLFNAISQTANNLDIDSQDYYAFRKNHLGTVEKIRLNYALWVSLRSLRGDLLLKPTH